MIKIIMRVLILIFLLESTWAAAAQYCKHETGFAAAHFGHHTHQHGSKDQSSTDQVISTDNKSVPGTDSDCPYCHLGAIKSMLPVITISAAATVTPDSPDPLVIYRPIFLRLPERPNWQLAA